MFELRQFSNDDAISAQIVYERAAWAIEAWLADGVELAMTRFNGSVLTVDEK